MFAPAMTLRVTAPEVPPPVMPAPATTEVMSAAAVTMESTSSRRSSWYCAESKACPPAPRNTPPGVRVLLLSVIGLLGSGPGGTLVAGATKAPTVRYAASVPEESMDPTSSNAIMSLSSGSTAEGVE